MHRLLAVIILSLLTMQTSASAGIILINDDFSTGSLSTSSRIRSNQVGGGWYVDNSPTSDWTIGGGNISNASTTTTSQTEGALSQIVSTAGLSNTLTGLTFSFDYVVGDTSTLKFALIGYTANLSTGGGTSNILMNNGTANGALQNNTQAELRYGDINLLTGADMTQSITNDLTFAAGTSGSYTGTFDLPSYAWHADEAAAAGNTPGLSGSISSVADFDFIALVVVNDLTTTTGASVTSLDNLMLQAVPEPSSFALIGCVLGCFAARRRRRRSNVSA